jgi:hypothetical protein
MADAASPTLSEVNWSVKTRIASSLQGMGNMQMELIILIVNFLPKCYYKATLMLGNLGVAVALPVKP